MIRIPKWADITSYKIVFPNPWLKDTFVQQMVQYTVVNFAAVLKLPFLAAGFYLMKPKLLMSYFIAEINMLKIWLLFIQCSVFGQRYQRINMHDY